MEAKPETGEKIETTGKGRRGLYVKAKTDRDKLTDRNSDK